MKVNKTSKEEIYVRVVKVIEEMLQVFREKDLRQRPKIHLESDIYSDLEVDSLEIMDVAVALEKEFGISLDVEKLAPKRLIRDIVDHIFDTLSGGKDE